MNPSVFKNIFKNHLKRKSTPLKKLAEDIDPNAIEGYVTIRKGDRFGNIVDTKVIKNKLTSISKSTIIRLLAQESTPWRASSFNPAQYRINRIRFGNAYEGAYAVTNERQYTGLSPISLGGSRDIIVPIYQDYQDPADLQRNYYNLYEPSMRPGKPFNNDLDNLTLANKKTAYGTLNQNAPKLIFQNIAAAQWASGKVELSLGNLFANLGLNNPLSDLDNQLDINKAFRPPFPNLVVDIYFTDTGKIMQRLIFKNIDTAVAGASTAYGADYTKGSNAVKPSVYMVAGADITGLGNRNMYVKLPTVGTVSGNMVDGLGGTGNSGGASYINNPNNGSFDLLLTPVANTLYEEHTDINNLVDIGTKLYFDFSQDSNGNFNGWKLVLDIAHGTAGQGIGGGLGERDFVANGLTASTPTDSNFAQAKLGVGISYDRGYYNVINSIVPKTGINVIPQSSNWNSNLNLDALWVANYKARFGASKDYYEVGNLKSFTVGNNAAYTDDFETSFSIIMGLNDGNGADPINGVVYTEAFLCSENDDIFSALRFAPQDRFKKNNQNVFFITWSIRAPL